MAYRNWYGTYTNPTVYYTAYNLNGLLPQHWLDWDEYETRLGRYDVLFGYYHNIAYHRISRYAEELKHQERLYKHVRGVYNPAARVAETYVSKVYGGGLDTQDISNGAIPIVTDNESLKKAIVTLWKSSRWQQKKSLYVRNGAGFGDSVLNIVDDIKTGNVYLEPVDPRKVKYIDTDSTGRVTEIHYEYMMMLDDRQVTYRLEVTEDTYKTFVDNAEYALYENARGQKVPAWDNEYGFVPAHLVTHRDVGMKFGGNAWYTVMHKVNELNDLASIQNDAARNQAKMPLFGFGLGNNSVDKGADGSQNAYNKDDSPRRDSQDILNFDVSGRIEAIAPQLDLGTSLALIQEILQEIERDLPELSLHRLREGGQLTAPGVRAAYDDAIARIQEARGNYDAGLVEAQKMAIAIGGMRGYEGYQGFNLMSYEQGNLEHYIDNRPVISDTLSVNEMLQSTFQAMSQNAPKAIYAKIGWGKTEIEEILEAQETNTSQFMNQFGAPTDNAPDESPQDASENERIVNISESDLVEADRLAIAS